MGFTTAPKLDAPRPAGLGISCSLRVSKRAASFWLILNEEAQKRYFGRTIIGEKADVAVGRGYDTKVLRKVIALRKRDSDDVAEEQAVLELYKSALGMS